MPRGIIIFGSSGSGKTTLGKMVAKELRFPYFDLDDYIWRKDTEKPFTLMYSKEEKANRLMKDILEYEHFVMAGSMDSFNAPFVPLFDLAVHINAASSVRAARIHKRELEQYGERILEGGDLFENHQEFLQKAMSYDSQGSPCLKTHLEWAKTLPCKVIFLNGEGDLDENRKRIVEMYKNCILN